MKFPNYKLIFAFWAALWFSRLYLVPAYFIRTQALDYYPVHADSIGIPIAGSILFTIIGAPVFAWCLISLFRGSKREDIAWLSWCAEHPIRSAAWTLVFGALFASCAMTCIEAVRLKLPLNAWADAGWCLLCLMLRAVTVSKLCRHEEPPEAARDDLTRRSS